MWLWGIIKLIIGGLQQLMNSKTIEKWEKFDDFREEIKQELNITSQLAKLSEIIAMDFVISRRE